MSRRKADDRCPCHSGKPYSACCGPLHGGGLAPDADALMRSRYCAYVLSDTAYVLATWHPATRPETLGEESQAPKWIGLDVLRHEQADADHAVVEFVARFRIGGRAGRMHEVSRFERVDGRWFYRDGTHAPP